MEEDERERDMSQDREFGRVRPRLLLPFRIRYVMELWVRASDIADAFLSILDIAI